MRRYMVWILVSLTCGCVDGGTPAEDADTGGDVVADGDVREDVEEDVEEDAGACEGACEGETPWCDEEEGRCVECLVTADCEGGAVCTEDGACVACTAEEGCGADQVCAVDGADGAGNECVACVEGDGCGADQVCLVDGADATNNECVGCTDDTHCTEAGAAGCDAATNTCVACEENASCEGVVAGEVCREGTCVECTAAEATACTEGVCDVRAGECTQRPAGSKGQCEPCVSDAECQAGHACIEMEYEGQAFGAFCLEAAPGCDRPFKTAINRESISGAEATDYCGIPESLTTCPAVNAMVSGLDCSDDASVCPTGGLCRRLRLADPGELTCTVECDLNEQCGSGVNCNDAPADDPDADKFCKAPIL